MPSFAHQHRTTAWVRSASGCAIGQPMPCPRPNATCRSPKPEAMTQTNGQRSVPLRSTMSHSTASWSPTTTATTAMYVYSVQTIPKAQSLPSTSSTSRARAPGWSCPTSQTTQQAHSLRTPFLSALTSAPSVVRLSPPQQPTGVPGPSGALQPRACPRERVTCGQPIPIFPKRKVTEPMGWVPAPCNTTWTLRSVAMKARWKRPPRRLAPEAQNRHPTKSSPPI